MKKITKIISVILAATCIVMSFAACSSEKQNNNSENVSSAETTEKKNSIFNFGNSEPETKEEFVSAFNAALEKELPPCSSSSQMLSAGKLWLGDNSDEYMDLLSEEQAELKASFEQANAGTFMLSVLNESNVADAVCNENTVTFTLTDSNASDNIAQGTGGYIALIDTDRTQALVESVKSFANVSGNVKISSANYKMSEGTLIVTFNKKFTEIESVEYTAKQKVNAEMKYLIMKINAELDYELKAEFK